MKFLGPNQSAGRGEHLIKIYSSSEEENATAEAVIFYASLGYK